MNIQPITRQLPKGFCKRAFSNLITSHFKRLWNSEYQSPGHRLHHSDVPVHILVLWEPQQSKASRRGQKSNDLVQIWRDNDLQSANEKTVNTQHKLSSEGQNDDFEDDDDDEFCLWQRQQ